MASFLRPRPGRGRGSMAEVMNGKIDVNKQTIQRIVGQARGRGWLVTKAEQLDCEGLNT